MAPSRAGDAFLRLAIAHRLPHTTRIAAPVASFCCSHRAFTTTTRKREERKDRATASNVSNDIASLLNSTLDLNKGTPTATSTRTSRFKSRDAQENTGSRGVANELQRARSNNDDSVSKLLDGLVMRAGNRSRRPSSYTSADIHSTFGALGGAPDISNAKEMEPVVLPPNVGRLVDVDERRNMDVGRAFRTMESLCNKNKVKRTFAQQRFHERPGLKRKRLKNERWIRRFRENFKSTVQLVQKMKKQGW